MAWIALTAVALLVALVGAVAAVALRNRRRARRMPGSFRCRVHEQRDEGWTRYPRLATTAWWVGGVLAVHGGLGLSLPSLFAVAAADAVRPLRPGEVRRLGDTPRSVLLLLDDGRLLEVAVAARDVVRLTAPLLPRQPTRRV